MPNHHTAKPLWGTLDCKTLARVFDLAVFDCQDCGKPAAAEHYDFERDRLIKLCRRCKTRHLREDD